MPRYDVSLYRSGRFRPSFQLPASDLAELARKLGRPALVWEAEGENRWIAKRGMFLECQAVEVSDDA